MALEPTTLYTLDRAQRADRAEIPRKFSWLGPNLTSHSAPDEQAYCQLSMIEGEGQGNETTKDTKHQSEYIYVHVLMRDKKEERKKQARSNKQTRQSNTAHPRQSQKNELPRVGLKPKTLYNLDRALYQLSYRGSSAGWAQISHLIVHLMNRLTVNSV